MEPVQNEAKVAIITGGTSGIGLLLARHLHAKGWRVALVGRRADVGVPQASSLDPSGETATFEQCDVASYSAQAAVFKNVWTKWARLDLLIANAGGVDGGSWYNYRGRGAAVDDVPPEPDTTCTDVHLKGLMYGTLLATHFMRHNQPSPGGKIIATTSIIGVHPCPTFPEYGAVEAGLNHWVRVNAPLLKHKENITINAVMMGPAITPVMPGFGKAFLPEELVLPATILRAYDTFINDDDNKRTGETVETAGDQLFWYDVPERKAGELDVRAMAVYEPWFAMIHGEKSGLEDALQEAPKGNAEDTGRVKEFEVGICFIMSNVKIIAITGATGAQGGGVVNVMKKTPGWKVRAVTRNPESEAAKQLAADGSVEVVRADWNDEASLVKAFEGVAAVFAVSNWWESLFSGKSQWESGDIEESHGMNLARAAAKTPTLEHYLWSTQPSSKRQFSGKLETPHMDYKANVDARIKAELPELARKTTYLYFGYYPQNMAYFPLLKPFEYILATDPQAKILLAGDMTVNPGIWVRQVLATGSAAFGKYARVALERWSFQEMMDKWSEITGKRGVVIQVSEEVWAKFWGTAGTELAWQFKFGELCDPWAPTDEFISPEELGIDASEVVGFEGTIRGLARSGMFD
ncbi:NAD(P)-binding protein [Parachaetomium inaequale]|uniref:NAD(P)-binding protein n=1 Tax=Parachaetomium inaequale TaxID=2588326 RepID=A0AAN6P719_9PEZI|nr:NAD(P)-binding protein [Parachaetomium inaequale]